jgi:hypothetical protein
VLDVDLVELDAVAPLLPRLQQVRDLVPVHVDGQHAVVRRVHQSLAQMRPDEAARPDHANLERLHGLPVQVHPPLPRHLSLNPPVLPQTPNTPSTTA